MRQGLRRALLTHSICINHEDVFVKCRINPNDVSHLMINLQLHRRHRGVEMHSVEVVKEQNLRVSLASVTGLGSLTRLPDLDNDDIADVSVVSKEPRLIDRAHLRYNVTFKFVQTRVDFAVIDLLRTLGNRLEHERFRVEFGVDTENIEDNSRCRPIVSTANNIPVAYHEDEFAFVVVLQGSE